MSYRGELLDGFEILYKKTDVSIDSCNEIRSFVVNLGKVYKDHAMALSKLVRGCQGKNSKNVDQEVGTLKAAWEVILAQLDSVAEQHQRFATTTLGELASTMQNYIKDKEKERKRLVGETQKCTKDMRSALDNMQSAKKKYHAACDDAQKVQAAYLKAKEDASIQPKALSKFASKTTQAQDKQSSADRDYRTQLQTANAKQRQYYTQEQPQYLDEFQRFEDDRLTHLKASFDRICNGMAEFIPNATAVSTTMKTSVSAINKDDDIRLWVNTARTGVSVPGEIPYEAFGGGSGPASFSESASPRPGNPGTTSAIKAPPAQAPKANAPLEAALARDWGLSASDASLPPDAQRSKLDAQIRELAALIGKEEQSKQGLEKLVKFYATDPVAQEKARGEVEDLDKKLHRLHEQRKKMDQQMASIPSGGGGGGGASYDDGAAVAASAGAGGGGGGGGGGGAQAKALFDYETVNDNELPFHEGDTLTIHEQDDTGWWFAEFNGRSGFIPSNFVQLL